MKKIIRITTIPLSLKVLLKNQLHFLNGYFKIIALSSPGKDLDFVGIRENVSTLAVPMERGISIRKDIRSLLLLIKTFNFEKPAAVHANTPKASLLSMVAARLSKVPIRLYTVTGLRFETETGLKRRILILMEQITCSCATHVIAESRGVKRMIIENRLTKKDAIIIGNGNINGIDEDYWDPEKVSISSSQQLKANLGINESDFIFLFVGRLTGSKGVNEIVEAFVTIDEPNFKLILLGPAEEELDPLTYSTQNLITNTKTIHWLGYQEDVRLYMSISSVLVLPSYREGFPNVILQASAMKLPCVVTDINGAEEVIDDANGIIINKRNVKELIDAMRFVAKNYGKFDRNYCREKVINLFSQKHYFIEILKFYQSLQL